MLAVSVLEVKTTHQSAGVFDTNFIGAIKLSDVEEEMSTEYVILNQETTHCKFFER